LATFRGVDTFRTAKQKSVIAEIKAELKLGNEAKCESEMTMLTSKLFCDDRSRTIFQGQETGQWLLLLPSRTGNGAGISAQEFRDALLLQHARGPSHLPPFCDSCNQKFSVCHALWCNRGGLIISRHNEIRDELSDLASKALSPSALRKEPKIHACRSPEVK
jgi:hypothetical protein